MLMMVIMLLYGGSSIETFLYFLTNKMVPFSSKIKHAAASGFHVCSSEFPKFSVVETELLSRKPLRSSAFRRTRRRRQYTCAWSGRGRGRWR